MEFINKWKPIIKSNIQQLMFVFLAFFVLVMVVFISASSMMQKQQLQSTNETLRTVEANIKTTLHEPEATLVSITYTIRNMIEEEGATQEDILKYITGLTDWLMLHEDRISGFNGIYGVIRGDYLDGLNWKPPADYVPEERPWYIAAHSSADLVASTAPYVDAQTASVVISYSEIVSAGDGEELGVIAIDVLLQNITDYVCSLQITEGGYGMLLDADLNIMAHPDTKLLGTPLEKVSADYARVAAQLKADEVVSGVRVKDSSGNQRIVFFRELYNSWYVAMLAPVDQYYRDMYVMEIGLCILGTVLMLALCGILLRLSAEKIQSEEKNKSKSSFLARVSHEIRTPMNAIIGMAELILRKDLPMEAREDAIAIKQAGDNLLSIINDVLDFSKIESGKVDFINKPYLFASLINDVVNIIRMRAMDKNLMFVVNIDSNLPSAFEGDETRIRQILLNLLGNAVKYTPAGHIALTISGVSSKDTVLLKFEITDTGVGISAEDIPKLFGEFYQVNMEANKGIEGTGLGLAITRSLSRLMSGDVTVESELGKGSKFMAEIPQRIVNATPLAAIENRDAKRVLVFEPRTVYANSLKYSLESLGVSFTIAVSPEDFRQALTKEDYPFIFASSLQFQQAKNIMEEIPDRQSVLVLLAEFGETIVQEGVQAISIPIHTISIANILNGTKGTGTDGYGQGGAPHVRFTAPSARILAVDDIATNLKVVMGLLAPYKMQIDCCISGREALDKISMDGNYDLVLMDHMMPGMDGIECTHRIRKLQDGKFEKLPIIALTANAVSGMKEWFLSNGFDDFIAKPIELTKLNDVMTHWIPKGKQLKSKQEKPAETSGESMVSKTPGMESLMKVSGLDAQRGVMMTGGSMKGYKEVLVLYCHDVRLRLPLLRDAPKEKDISSFITQVHALKSASASIGAGAVAKTAALLELAGKDGDFAKIQVYLPGFYESISSLTEDIEDALAAYAAQTAPAIQEKGSEADLDKALLEQLRVALEAENIKEIDELLEQLENQASTEEGKVLAAELSDYALVSEFDKAIAVLDDYLRRGMDGE